jgi:hypothetical protein
MKFKKINVMGQEYKITTKVPNDIPLELLQHYYGRCDREKMEIWIKDSLSNEQKYRTLFHELGHAVFARSGVLYSGAVNHELEEILVEVFGNHQYEFMRDYIKGLLKLKPEQIVSELKKFLSKN